VIINANVADYSVPHERFDGFKVNYFLRSNIEFTLALYILLLFNALQLFLKVLVHSSDEFSDVSDRGFVISPGHETWEYITFMTFKAENSMWFLYLFELSFVALKVISTSVTSEVIDEVSPQKRQCEVPEQRALNSFANYSRPKCIIDCIIQEMLRKCGCRPYFLNGNRPIFFSLFIFNYIFI